MAYAFKMDGISYDVIVPVGGFKRKGDMLDGANVGRATSGAMIFDTIGMYYNYSLTINRSGNNVPAYDALYEALTNPSMRAHTVEMLYGQGTITFTAYVSGITDELDKVENGVQYWDSMTLDIIAVKPYRAP